MEHGRSESSPLLGRQDNPDEALTTNEIHPTILDIERVLYSRLPLFTTPEVIQDTVDGCSPISGTQRDPFILLLAMRRISGHHLRARKDVPMWAFTPAPQIEQYASELWKAISSIDSDAELDEVLWKSFDLDGSTRRKQLVVEALLSNGSPSAIALDVRLTVSISNVWRTGRPFLTDTFSTLPPLAVPRKLRQVATPRVLHLMDLAGLFIYMIVSVNYILVLPNMWDPKPDGRAIFMLVYAISCLVSVSWTRIVPYTMAALALLSSPRLALRDEDSAYAFLLFSISILIVQLQLPVLPSPVFSFPFSKILPISTIFQTVITHIAFPAFLFMLPVMVIIFVLFSITMKSSFCLTYIEKLWCSFSLEATATSPAPSPATYVFLTLGAVMLILFACLLASMVLASPSIVSAKHAWLSWDVFGPKVGLETRQIFCNATVHYSDSFYFPAPLNLLRTAIVDIPCWTLAYVFRRKHLAIRYRSKVEPLLWSVVVLPIACIFGSAWLWGYLW